MGLGRLWEASGDSDCVGPVGAVSGGGLEAWQAAWAGPGRGDSGLGSAGATLPSPSLPPPLLLFPYTYYSIPLPTLLLSPLSLSNLCILTSLHHHTHIFSRLPTTLYHPNTAHLPVVLPALPFLPCPGTMPGTGMCHSLLEAAHTHTFLCFLNLYWRCVPTHTLVALPHTFPTHTHL